jgi:predicted alpha/beta-fold hydrolase
VRNVSSVTTVAVTMAGRITRYGLTLVGLYLAFSIAFGIFLAERALRLDRKPLQHQAQVRQRAAASNALMEDAMIRARDGAPLRAWVVTPREWNHDSILLLHGIADNREGTLALAEMAVARGYQALLVDARAHGESGGELFTYGILEREDVSRWVDWLMSVRGSACVYEFGGSIGEL